MPEKSNAFVSLSFRSDVFSSSRFSDDQSVGRRQWFRRHFEFGPRSRSARLERTSGQRTDLCHRFETFARTECLPMVNRQSRSTRQSVEIERTVRSLSTGRLVNIFCSGFRTRRQDLRSRLASVSTDSGTISRSRSADLSRLRDREIDSDLSFDAETNRSNDSVESMVHVFRHLDCWIEGASRRGRTAIHCLRNERSARSAERLFSGHISGFSRQQFHSGKRSIHSKELQSFTPQYLS